MHKYDDLLMWVDLETTGTDVRYDDIIEIAAIWTDTELEEVSRWEAVIRWSDEGKRRIDSNDVVFEMHRINGLYNQIESGVTDYVADMLWPDNDLRSEMERVNLASGRPAMQQQVLAGSGVAHFDRRFLDANMPAVTDMLRYYCVDVGVVRRAWRMWTGETVPAVSQADKTHRAMDDIESHLDEARRFQSFWVTMLDPPF